jgi:UDP-hydrolysing UDP-N-acetyl-D-glucosamine 2-epimerase
MLISTSRADASALQVVYEALKPEHETVQYSIDSGYSNVFESARAALNEHRPDLAFVHGDRWDALLAATACVVSRTRLAHLGGGDITEGSYDNRFRAAITKLAEYHFVSTQQAAENVASMSAGSVYVVGEPAIDWLYKVRDDLPDYVATNWDMRGFDGYILVNWQPETLAEKPNAGLALILKALARLPATTAIFFASPNNDNGSEEVVAMLADFALTFTGHRLVPLQDVGRGIYASLMKYCKVMIGNSSSGLIEAPALGTRFIMVGDRQKGRPVASSAYQVGADGDADELAQLIIACSTMERFYPHNPYGDGRAGERIAAALRHKAG